jgi:hypothetical protein
MIKNLQEYSINAQRERLERSMLAAMTGLAVTYCIGISWYFAEKIRSEALAVEPGPAIPAYDDAQFIGLQARQAQLLAIGDQPALVKPELYGIAWQGGLGHLGASVTVSNGVVTRPLTVTSGTPPRVGQFAGLERAFFLGEVERVLGIPMEDLSIPGPLGPLPAWYFPGRGRTFIIGVHGQNGTRKDMLRVIDIVRNLGFPALAVTYRNDLGATRDPSGYLRYGQTEWRDIEAAVQWSLAHGAQSVILVAQSMGGGVAAAFLQHSPLAPKVARVVFDAPMLDLHAVIDYQVDRHCTPVIGRALTPLIWTAKRIASMRFGVDWSAISYLDETSWLKVPALVTHGGDDPRVPIAISTMLKEMQPTLVTFELFPGAGHLESWNIDRARYTSLIESFLAPAAP